jgi:hypothetical protein
MLEHDTQNHIFCALICSALVELKVEVKQNIDLVAWHSSL